MNRDITGINGAWAVLHGGTEKHHNASFTMFATIEPSGDLFKKTFYGYDLTEARKIFKNELQNETNRYFVEK